MLRTKKGNPMKPPRVMIYGVEGVGKTTLGAQASNPIFISPEGGTDRVLNSQGQLVDEFETMTTWDHVRGAVKSLMTEKHDFQTVVLDSADWIEKLCHSKIIGNSGKSITTCLGGYGAGYRQAEIMHKELIEDLAALREKRNMTIIITAHAHVKPVKDPSMLEDYDSYEIKCHEMVSSLWREWVDTLLFARFHTVIKPGDDGTKARAMGDGRRVVYTVKSPSFQAKNRYGLKPEYDFTPAFWNEFITHVKNTTPKSIQEIDIQQVIMEIIELQSKITDLALQEKVAQAIHDSNNDPEKLRAIYKRLKSLA